MKKLVNLVALLPIFFLFSCKTADKIEEVRKNDGTSAKVVVTQEYPYTNFVELYPDARVTNCVKPMDQADSQPTVFLSYNGKGKGPKELAEWYQGKLEPQGFEVKIEKTGISRTLYASKGEDVLSVSIVGNDADGIIKMTASKRTPAK